MRTMISNLELNEKYTLPLVVMSAAARKTKTGKDFLSLTFFDGVDTINGNYWDWAGVKIPANNSILNVSCTVTEWAGALQLNIKSLATSTEYVLADFMPTSENDVACIYKDAFAMACDIKHEVLRQITVGALDALREQWIEVPGAKHIHHAYIGGTLVHSYSVAKTAKKLAESIPEANVDLCVAGALLHDVGKLFTYEMDGLVVDMTNDGMLHDHIFIGANFIGNFAETVVDIDAPKVEQTVKLLQHIILSHHGKLEYGSPVTPLCLEAHIVHMADNLDATVEQIRVESKKVGRAKWTDKIYTLNNRPQLTPVYVSALLGEE